MRKTIYFDDHINVQTVLGLIKEIEAQEEVDLYFSTEGGEVDAMNVLIHSLNRHPDIEIFITSVLGSAGTHLFAYCYRKIHLTKGLDYIFFHCTDRESYNIRKSRYIDKEVLVQQDIEHNKDLAKRFRKIGLTEEEIKSYLEGEDVILYRKDFKRLNLNEEYEKEELLRRKLKLAGLKI